MTARLHRLRPAETEEGDPENNHCSADRPRGQLEPMNRLIVSLALGSVIAVGCTTEDDSLSTGTGVTVVSTTVTETSTTAPAGPETTTGEVEATTTSSPETTAPPPPETSGPETTVAPDTTAAPATTLPPSSTLTDPTQTMWIAGSEEGDPEAVSDGTNCLPFYEAFGVGTLSYAACGPWVIWLRKL